MYEQDFTSETDRIWIPPAFGQMSHPEETAMSGAQAWLHHVPVMPVTVLALDLLLQESSIDLSTLSRLVLGDVGATLHLFHILSEECTAGYIWPRRMNECLAVIDIESWFSRLSAHAAVSHTEHSEAIASLWKHSHLIAVCTAQVAGELEDISTDSAYLIGLLHETKAIASLFGLSSPHSSGDVLESIGVAGFICAALKESSSGPAMFWKAVLAVAHKLAEGRSNANFLLFDPAEASHIRSRVLSELSTAQTC